MQPDESEIALLRRLVRRLEMVAQPVKFDVARTPDERQAIYAQRCETVIARNWAQANEFPDQMERDEYDGRSVHVRGLLGKTLVASGRIVLPESGRPLPVEAKYGMEPNVGHVEIGRTIVAVNGRSRRHQVFAGLMGQCLHEVLDREYFHIVACASRQLLRIYRRMGLEVTILNGAAEVWGEQRYPVKIDLVTSAKGMLEKFPLQSEM